MITLAQYPSDKIMPLLGLDMPTIKMHVNGERFSVKASSVRLECFKRNPKCVACGVVGTTFKLQRHESTGPKLHTNCFLEQCPWCAISGYKMKRNRHAEETPHLNLFGRYRDGSIVLMTKDHIYPRSKGGSDDIDNMQTLCYRCNQFKADTIPKDLNVFQRTEDYRLVSAKGC